MLRSQELLPKIAHEGHKHFAYLLDGSHVMAIGVNNIRKTNPAALKHYRYPFVHAELNVITKFLLPPSELRYMRMVSIRLSKNGDVLLAKPCLACQSFLEAFRLKEVWYSENAGNFELLA